MMLFYDLSLPGSIRNVTYAWKDLISHWQPRAICDRTPVMLRSLLYRIQPHWAVAALCGPAALGLGLWLQAGTTGTIRDTVAIAVASGTHTEVITLSGDARVAVVTAPDEAGGLDDLWAVALSVTPSGVPVRAGRPRNLSKTTGAEEKILAVSGTLALIGVQVDGDTVSLSAYDLRGESPSLTEDWGNLDREKSKISNWQSTGRRTGVGWQRVVLPIPVRGLMAASAADRTFRLTTPGGAWGVVTFAPGFAGGPQLTQISVTERPKIENQTKGRQGHLGWVVDTVRDLPFIGPVKIALLEDFAFEALDLVKRQTQSTAPDDGPGLMAAKATSEPWDVATGNADDVELRAQGDVRPGRIWPPRPATPRTQPAGTGEGEWRPVTSLIRPSDDGVPYIYQSWIRPDLARNYARVSVTAFDPSRTTLRTVAGTKEPESTTGLKGTGRIPREPGVLPRLVAAFNGGFQSKHGPYGMIANGRVLVPAAGDAATVAITAEGRVLFGTWPATGPSPGWKSLPPGAALPPGITSLRQNLQPLVADGQFNPGRRRRKWGSVAGKHVKDDTHTVRTGICLLDGGGYAYFFGPSLSADSLAQAMQLFHCDYGVHLDMNSGHSGFEFYRVEDDTGEKFEAARMIDAMWHMNFPRYIRRDARDFFYVTLRRTSRERLRDTTGREWKPVGGRPDAPSEVLQSSGIYRLPSRRTTGEVWGGRELPAGTLLIPVARGPIGVKVVDQLLKVAQEAEAVTLLAWNENDVFVTGDGARRSLLESWGCQIASIPRPADTEIVLRLMDMAGTETLRGGPLDRDSDVLALSVAPASGMSGRLEGLFTGTAPGVAPPEDSESR
jgi:hypothetical protein